MFLALSITSQGFSLLRQLFARPSRVSHRLRQSKKKKACLFVFCFPLAVIFLFIIIFLFFLFLLPHFFFFFSFLVAPLTHSLHFSPPQLLLAVPITPSQTYLYIQATLFLPLHVSHHTSPHNTLLTPPSHTHPPSLPCSSIRNKQFHST